MGVVGEFNNNLKELEKLVVELFKAMLEQVVVVLY